MLNISEELRTAFLTDSMHKDIQIEFEDGSEKYAYINFTESPDPAVFSQLNAVLGDNKTYISFYVPWIPDGNISPINECFSDADYLCISGHISINKLIPATGVEDPSYIRICVNMVTDGMSITTVYGDPIVCSSSEHDFRIEINTDDYAYLYRIQLQFLKADLSQYGQGDIATELKWTWSDVEIDLGNNLSRMPFRNTKSIYDINQEGKNWNDYLNKIVVPDVVTNDYLDQNAFNLSEHICSANVLKFGASEGAMCSFTMVGVECEQLAGKYFTASIGCDGIEERVPLGRFRVKSVTKEGAYNIVKKRIDAYDGMYPLSMDATDWFTKNIGIYNEFYVGSEEGKLLPRQLFNTLEEALNTLGIMLFDNFTSVTGYLKPLSAGVVGTRVLEWRNNGINYSDFIEYAYLADEADPSDKWFAADPTKAYKIDMGCDYRSDIFAYIEDGLGNYADTFAMYPDNAGIVIIEYATGSVEINRFCVSDKTWFTLDPNTNYFKIGIPTRYHCYTREGSVLHDQTFDWPSEMIVYEADYNYNLANASVPLVYFNWQTGEVAHPTNISFRDVIRSLVEPTGTFFKYGRDGKVQFAEASYAGVYPSEDLYPSDDLYPSAGQSQIVPMPRYKSFKAGETETNDFGTVQVIASDLRTYVGNADKPNTYIMDDNVFYCDSVVTYALNYDGTDIIPYASEMLENFYNKISGMHYTPCEIDMVGMPWVECGDRLGLLTNSGGFESFVFNRTLSGIQVLDDNIEALGETETEQIVDLWR